MQKIINLLRQRKPDAPSTWLAKLPEQIKVAKPRVLESLTQADGLLDQLLASNNRDEFQQAVGPALLRESCTEARANR